MVIFFLFTEQAKILHLCLEPWHMNSVNEDIAAFYLTSLIRMNAGSCKKDV